MKKPALIGVLLVAAIGGVIAYSTMNLAKTRVEVCVSFKGQTNCKTVRGNTKEDTLRTAITNACADIAFGVTETLACERAEPVKITWLD